MKAFLISPTDSLIEKIAEHLTGTEKDYSSNLVVFPGKRPSHFLRKVLGEEKRSSVIPPLIFSMDEFIDFIYEETLDHGAKKLETIDTVAILYDIHKTSPTPLGSGSFLTPDSFFPIGLKIYIDLEELHIEGLAPSLVKETDHLAGEKLPELTARRLQSLSYFYEAFYKRIEENHYSTRSSRYRAVSAEIDRVDLNGFRNIILAGFFALTKSEKKIFKSLMERGNTLFLFQDGLGIDLSDLGITVRREAVSREPEVHCYKSPDTHGQVFGLSSLLKNRIANGERLDEKTVIVLPSPETLFPLFHHALSLLEPEHYNISLGYPLQRTPLFGFFNSLMELVLSMDGDRLYVPHYLEFILHPYTKNIYFQGRSDITRILFHTIEEALTERRTRKFVSLSEIERDEVISSFIRERFLNVEPELNLEMVIEHLKAIHRDTIKKMVSFKDVGDFAKKLKEVIEYIYENSTARLHPFFYPYAESFVTHLGLISRSLMREMRFEETGSYFTLIKKYMMTTYTPFAGTPLKGVQVLGFLETRNIKFENVLFLDVNEGIIPDTTREDSLLPFKVRRILGLPTYLDKERLMAYYFDTLINGAREVHLFYVENDEKERSRFVEKLLWERQKRERKNDDKSDVKAIQYSVMLQPKGPRPTKKSDDMIRFLRHYCFSASSLDTYLHCPLQFYYQYVLGLRERERVSDELEREETGLFVHQILCDYFKGKTGRALSEKDMRLKELEKIIRCRFEEHYGKDPTGETYLLKRQIENHLKDFIKNYQIPKIKECSVRIVNLEQKIEVERESFRLGARLDRVEKRGRRTVIMDYKTSANKKSLSINYSKLDLGNRDGWGEVIGTLQLPFYLIVYSQATGEKPEDIDCLFLLLGRTRIDTAIELPLFQGEAEFSERFGELYDVIFSLLREMVDPKQLFTPTTTPGNYCDHCTYQHICNH